MKVLLINPPWKRFFGESTSIPPLVLSYLGAYIKSEMKDLEIEVYDADLELERSNNFNPFAYINGHDKYLERLNDDKDIVWQELQQTILEYKPDVVGITVMTATYSAAVIISKIVKKIIKKIRRK